MLDSATPAAPQPHILSHYEADSMRSLPTASCLLYQHKHPQNATLSSSPCMVHHFWFLFRSHFWELRRLGKRKKTTRGAMEWKLEEFYRKHIQGFGRKLTEHQGSGWERKVPHLIYCVKLCIFPRYWSDPSTDAVLFQPCGLQGYR